MDEPLLLANIREHRLDVVLTPDKTITVRCEYHYFMLNKTKDAWYFPGKAIRRDKTGYSGHKLGNEIDLIAQKKISEFLEIMGGYSVFIPGEFVKNTGPNSTAQWWFLQTRIIF